MKYKYNKAENKIVEVGSFGRADWWNTESEAEHDAVEEAYSNLKSYDCHPSCIDIWEDGKELSESDFELQWQRFLDGVDKWVNCKKAEYDAIAWQIWETHRRQIAYPMSPTPPVVNEDEVWEDIAVAIAEHDDVRGAIEYMQKNYTVTKKINRPGSGNPA